MSGFAPMASDEASAVAAEGKPRGLTWVSLVAIGFFWVSGGIYGNEELLGAGPPLVALGLTALLPLLFALPNALTTAELATAFPADGGQAVWVELAFGRVVGRHNAYWLWVTTVVDAAIYPQMALRYLQTVWQIPAWGQRLFVFGAVGAISAISMSGIDAVGRSQAVCFVLTLAPCAVFIICGLPALDPAAFLATDGAPADLALLLSWTLWLYSGFSWLGCLAGEVQSPRRTYLLATAVLLPLVTALNLLPLMVSLSLDPEPSHYSAGYFRVLAVKLLGDGLGLAFALGSNVALLGLYHAQAVAADTYLAALAAPDPPSAAPAGGDGSGLEAGGGPDSAPTSPVGADASPRERDGSPPCCWPGGDRAPLRAHPPQRCARLWAAAALGLCAAPRSGGVRRVYVIADAAVICLLLLLDFRALVEIEMMLYAISHLVFFAAFLALRLHRPEAPRPFQLPGGVPFATAILLVPTAICGAVLAVNLASPGRAIVFGAVLALGVVVHAATALYGWIASDPALHAEDGGGAPTSPAREIVPLRYGPDSAEPTPKLEGGVDLARCSPTY